MAYGSDKAMEPSVVAHVEVAYLAVVTRGRERTPYEWRFATTVAVSLRQVAAEEAPKSIEARWTEGGSPASMHWRSFEGALWRPLVGPDGDMLEEAGGLERLLDESRRPRKSGRGSFEWPDYPFRIEARESSDHGRTPFGAWREEDDNFRIRSSDRDASLARAQARAADDLLLVDGVLHVRSVPPVWAVGRPDPLRDPGYVRLVVPDFPGHVDWLASFPLDRRGDALAFAGRHVADVVGNEVYQRLYRYQPHEVNPEEAEVEHGPGPFPDTRAADLRAMMDRLEYEIRDSKAMSFDRGFRKALGDLGAAVDSLPATVDHPGGFDEAEAAVRAFADAADPEWPDTWPNMGTQVARMRALAIRYDVEAEAAMAANADAFAGPGM